MVHPEWTHCGDSDYSGGTILQCGYRARVNGTVDALWPTVNNLGGQTGYYAADMLWKIRGLVDIVIGGVGLNRGRRSRERLQVGDALDFWRVLDGKPPSKLLLLAEMQTPGQALLEIRIDPVGDTQCSITLLSRFLPKGLAGLAYWYILYPFHQYVFSQMLKGMGKAAGLDLASPPQRFTPKISRSCTLR